MSEPTTPREVVARLIDLLAAGRFAEVPDLYAEDCVLDVRFALPPRQELRGRAAIQALTQAVDPATYPKMVAADIVLYETQDPEVVIAEWDYVGTSPDGEPFRSGNIIVARVRDGAIVHSRDYHNHVAFAAAVGMLPALLASIEATSMRPQAQ